MSIKNHFKAYLVLALFAASAASAQPSEHSITVQGVGEVKADNNQATVNASVTTQHIDANQALMTNNNIINNMIAELNAVGIESDDITTNQFNFQPDYRWENNSYVFRGYTVTNGLEITIDAISTVGSVLNLLVDTGATRVNAVRFGTEDLSAIRQQALVKALADARLKADVIAQTTGVTLGGVIRVHLSSSSHLPPSHFSDVGEASLAASPVPIAPGENTIREQVSVSYLIVD